jgi:hypothetical protein
MKALLADLPALYARLLPDLFAREIPEESLSTCSHCAMACGTAAQPTEPVFSPNVKCCAYFPGLPNYLLGEILDDHESADGRDRIRALIARRIGVTPMGIESSPTYRVLFSAATGVFGRSERLLCPYYQRDSGRCAIWRHRDAVCATYFCKPVAGAAGKAFWNAVKQYLLAVEKELCNYVLLESGFTHVFEIATDFHFTAGTTTIVRAADLEENAPSAEIYRQYWQHWAGREEEFYRHAAAIVADIPAQSVATIMGRRHETMMQHLESTWQRMEAATSARAGL